LLAGCSSKDIIITDQVAYYVDDDSVSVIAELKKIEFPDTTVKTTDHDILGDTAPIPIETEVPKYPRYQIGRSTYLIEGEVWVKIWITKQGKVTRAYILKSSDKTFNKSCLEAAMQWEFKPATTKGEPVAVWASIPFRFRFRFN
jgi:TonB family protein